jgi:hypothetical protein
MAMESLGKLYRLKDSPAKPSKYLGADIFEHFYPDTSTKRTLGISSHQFVKEEFCVVELELDIVGKRFATKVSKPMVDGYHPELDITPLLDAQKANYYQELIGILR